MDDNALSKVLYKIRPMIGNLLQQIASIYFFYYSNQIIILILQSLQMSKRPASYDIDQHTYEEKERARQDGQPIQAEGKHMIGRKIFKVARNSQTPLIQEGDKVDLKIEGLNEIRAKEVRKDAEKDVKVPENPFKFDLFKQSEGVGLFTNTLFSNAPVPNSKQNPQQVGSKEPAKSQIAPSSLLNPTTTETKPNIFSTSPSSFFSGGLFSQANPSSILFGGSTNPASFSTGSLFGNTKLSGPITSPPNDKPEDDEGDSQQLQKAQEMEVDPNKSTFKFDYGSQQKIVKRIFVAKYKKDRGNLIEGVEAILSYDSTKKIHYLIVRLAATKNIIFTGLLLAHKSTVKRNGENLDVLSFSFSEKKAIETHRIKMQIKVKEEQLDQFFEEINRIVQGKTESSDC